MIFGAMIEAASGSLIGMQIRPTLALAVVFAFAHGLHAEEHITLTNGMELDCVRREVVAAGDALPVVRLYLQPASESTPNYLEVPAASILRAEAIPDLAPSPVATPVGQLATTSGQRLAAASPSLPDLLRHAGTIHNIDADLLAAVVHAESNGNVRAVSHAGAQGLMQLMPTTANDLGVTDTFAPEQNIAGGTTYLDALLTRYHNDPALALAAYNAGPAAVDRYHGIPPYAETRAYVARVLREFNRRKRAAAQPQLASR